MAGSERGSLTTAPLGGGVQPRPNRTALAVIASLVVHALVILALVSARSVLRQPSEVRAINVALVAPAPIPPPPSQPGAPPRPTVHSMPSASEPLKPRHADPTVVSTLADRKTTSGPSANLSDAELARGTGVGEGGGGSGSGADGGCDMAKRLQAALRNDQRVQAAVAAARPGRGVRVWSGQWVQTGGEDGKGLSVLREAIMWEVAFAPPACRAEPMHGLILLSLTGSPDAPKLGLGGGDWRWSDLLK